MAEIWGAALVAGATVASTAYSANQAGRAARAGQRGADAATNESARQYDQTREDFAPWRQAGGSAVNQLSRLFGLGAPRMGGSFDATRYLRENPDVAADSYYAQNPQEHWEQRGQFEGRTDPFVGGTAATPAGAPDMSGFTASPNYQFRRDEGMRGIENSAAASGGAFSGNALRALTDFNSNLASGEFQNYVNNLAGIAGTGQTATNQTAAYGADHAANAGRNAMIGADARASGIIGRSNAAGNTMQDLAGLYGYWRGNQRQNSANAFGNGMLGSLGY